MSDEAPQGDAAPSAADKVAQFLAAVKEQMFDKPLPEELSEATGHAPSEYTLVNREVKVDPWECNAGHHHKDITLVETFNLNAQGAPAPALSLDAAIEQFKAEAATEPEGSLGIADETDADGGIAFNPTDGSIIRMATLHQAFETEASLNGGGARPGVMFLTPEMLAQLLGGQFPLGEEGPDDEDDLPPSGPAPNGPN
jgi:hypothetical protein